VTERGLAIADGASACPFVAFEDDRDERSSVPDHRHRCYAETPPAPRAIAHQEAYCLSSAFPVCPVFQDWARREAARTRGGTGREPTADTGTDVAAAAAPGAAAEAGGAAVGGAAAGSAAADGKAAGAGAAATGAAGGGTARARLGREEPAGREPFEPLDGVDAASVSDGPAAADDRETAEDEGSGQRAAPTMPGTEPETVRRNPPRDWAAPPPWLASAEGSVGGGDPDAEPPAFLGRRAQDPGQGLAGSAADRLAGGQPPTRRAADGDRWSPGTDADEARRAAIAGAAAGLTAGAAATPRAPQAPDAAADWEAGDDAPPQRRISRRSRAYAQHLGGPDGPDWERPRRYEAYPTIRTRVGMPQVPRLAVMAGAILVLAIVLFLLPGFLNIGGGGTAAPGASASAPTASRAASRAPTVPPAPTPTVYTVKKGDTLSKIASRNGLTLEELLAANPGIKNPNKVGEGQQIIIPAPSGGPAAGGGSPSPAGS